MKTKNKIILCVAGAVLLTGFGEMHFCRSMFINTYALVDLPAGIRIDSIIFEKNIPAAMVAPASPGKNILWLKVTKEDIHIPWTRYLPFYQFGEVSGTLFFDADVLDRHWKHLSVSASENIARYGVFPQFSVRKNLEATLQDTAANSFKAVTY